MEDELNGSKSKQKTTKIEDDNHTKRGGNYNLKKNFDQEKIQFDGPKLGLKNYAVNNDVLYYQLMLNGLEQNSQVLTNRFCYSAHTYQFSRLSACTCTMQ